MAFVDDLPPKRERRAEPEERLFELPAHQKTEFQAKFFEALEQSGLRIDRDVELSMAPLGSRGNMERAESFFVTVTFTAQATGQNRPALMEIHDLLDEFDPRQLIR